jgi:dipeptidyl-peptidase-2/lysosomal Pro-X carboxypeptidase
MQSLFCLAVSSLALVASAIPTESFADVVPRASNPNTATVPNQPPAVPPNLQDCDFKFYTQAIDHFGQHNGTFQQKYNLVTDFFKPGGPIFFYQGEEQTYLDCVDTSIAYTWAKETNGIAVVLEHRYFGVSVPFGVDNPANATQQPYFDYLTLDNVLEDGVTFLESVKKNVTGAQDSKVIVLSGMCESAALFN